MKEKNDKKNVIANLGWRFAERCGAQGVAFIVQIVLARMILPELYGTIAIVTVITGILQVFVDSGLGAALIQKKDADEIDFSTVFFFNMALCIVLYTGLFLAAPWIAKAYKMNDLTPVIRVLGLVLIISGLKNILHAHVSRNMEFKKFFFATLTGTIVAAFVGIFMAYKGLGVWALVAQNLVNKTIDTVFLLYVTKWKPVLKFSFERLKGMLKFGWKLLASALLSTVANDINQLIIGLKYSASDLSFFNRGKQLPSLVVDNINSSIDSVLFPAMSKVQNNKERLKEYTRRSIRTSTYIMMPIFMGLAVCGKPLVKLILTDKWLPCVPFLCIFCFSKSFMPIHTANLNAIKSLGRSDIFLRLDIIKKVISLVLLICAIPFGPMAIACVNIVTSVLSQLINSFPNKKLLNYGYWEQLKDMLPQIICSVIMGAIVYSISLINMNIYLLLAIQIIVGIATYVLLSIWLKIDIFYELLGMLKGLLKFKKVSGKKVN